MQNIDNNRYMWGIQAAQKIKEAVPSADDVWAALHQPYIQQVVGKLTTDFMGRPVSDTVNSPSHYKLNPHGIECIDAIEASMEKQAFRGYLKGNILKYLWRFTYKGRPLEDLKKAQWYMNRLIGTYEVSKGQSS